MTRQNWRQVTRAGIPPLVVTRRSLVYGDKTIEIGGAVNGSVPDHRLRPLYEARRIAPAPVANDPVIQVGEACPVIPGKKEINYGRHPKQAK